MYKKRLIPVLPIISMLILSISGCGRNGKEAFADVEDIADEQQINIHFDWMDYPITDEDSSMIYFTLTDTKTNKQGSISCGAEPEDGKLGIKISTEEDGWKIGSLYYEPAQTKYSFLILTEEDQVDPQVKRDAEWKLSPLLEDYHIWLDDVVDYPAMETETEPVDICYITDTTSGTHYLVTLTYVWNNRVNS